MKKMENKQIAINYHNKGFSVIPLRPKEKIPLLGGWQKYCQVRSTREEVELWWSETPDANIGIACGPANKGYLFVVDQDVLKDRDGKPILNPDGSFKEKGNINNLPATLSQTTGSGGKQLFYWAPTGMTVKNSKPRYLVDIRGDGGQVVVAPSVHPNGNKYEWDMDFNSDDIAEFPAAELGKFLNNSNEAKVPVRKVLSGLPVGKGLRHMGIAQVAGFYLRDAKSLEEIEMARIATYAWDMEMNKSPEPEAERRREIDNWIEAISKREMSKVEQKITIESSRAVLVRMSDVKSVPISWLWPERFALGKLCLIAGDPGIGKSLFTATLAATVSTGGTWPVDNMLAPQGDVILLSAEDDPADTIKPRLDAAGADSTRIHILRAIQEKGENGEAKERMFSFQKDVRALEKMLEDLPNCKLVVIDPVSAYLDGTDSHNNADVRGVLAPLSEMAMRHKVSIILIHHLNKNGGGNALYRTMGSLAFTAAVRTAFLVTLDKDDKTRRLFLQTKNNIAKPTLGLAYTVKSDADKAPVIVWEKEYLTISANEALNDSESPEDRTDTDWGITVLRNILSNGPVSVAEATKQAKDAGVTGKPLRSAREKLGIRPYKEGFDKGWVWKLPADEDAHHAEDDPL